jgi:hypothetical protein
LRRCSRNERVVGFLQRDLRVYALGRPHVFH